MANKGKFTLIEIVLEGESPYGRYTYPTMTKVITESKTGRSLYLRALDAVDKEVKRLQRLGWHITDVFSASYRKEDGTIVEVL